MDEIQRISNKKFHIFESRQKESTFLLNKRSLCVFSVPHQIWLPKSFRRRTASFNSLKYFPPLMFPCNVSWNSAHPLTGINIPFYANQRETLKKFARNKNSLLNLFGKYFKTDLTVWN